MDFLIHRTYRFADFVTIRYGRLLLKTVSGFLILSIYKKNILSGAPAAG
jgi:hypothetical protein